MTNSQEKYYLDIGNAKDELLKTPGDRAFFRFFEILPGAISWITLIGVVLCSWLAPVFIAFFIIAFDIYWLLKTIYLSFHLGASYRRMKRSLKTDWLEVLKTPSFYASVKRRGLVADWQQVYHLIILPMYKESYEVVSQTFEAIINSKYPKEKFIVVLTYEQRAGEQSRKTAERIKQEYQNKFFKLLVTCHPQNVIGELAGKGSNETWAGRKVKEQIIDTLEIPYENIIVSVFDVDTRVFPQYFACLTYNFLIAKNPHRSSFQPIPIYNNNIWMAPGFSRIVASSTTFWQMMEQERPERLVTFSSQALSFKALVEMDFWNVKNVSEDSRIFWRALMYYNGDYETVPLFYPVSMDANLATSFWQTVKNIYKQQRRWGWGSENIPYFAFGSLKNKKMPFWQKIRQNFNQLEGFWSWGTNALLIFLLGWLPLILGGDKFNVMVLSYNLPRITSVLMTIAMVGLMSSAIYSTILLPARPSQYTKRKYIFMVLQWVLIPITIIIFGSIPAIEAQTRLMFGRYMGFWVTPKTRKFDIKDKML